MRAATAGASCRCSATDQAIDRPSKVEVPRPTSSSRIRERAVALLRMFAVSFISTRKVLWPRARLSDAPTRLKIRSTSPIVASVAGTNEPAWAIRTIRATCLR